MSNMTIKDYQDNTSIDSANDYFLGEQNSTGDYRRYTRNSIMGVTGQPADISSVQTFTNKSLTTPVITSIYQDVGKTKLMTLPNTASDTLVAVAATQTLLNKTLTSPTITAPTVTGGMSVAGTLAAANNATVGGTLTVTGVLTPSGGLSAGSVTNAALVGGITGDKLANTAITLGYASASSSQSGISTVADLTNNSVTVTVPSGGRAVKITGCIPNLNGSNPGDKAQLSIQEGSTVFKIASLIIATLGQTLTCIAYLPAATATAGSHTYKLTLARSNGTGTLNTNAGSSVESFILVELI